MQTMENDNLFAPHQKRDCQTNRDSISWRSVCAIHAMNFIVHLYFSKRSVPLEEKLLIFILTHLRMLSYAVLCVRNYY